MSIYEAKRRHAWRQRNNRIVGKNPPPGHEWRMDERGNLIYGDGGKPVPMPLKVGRPHNGWILTKTDQGYFISRNSAFTLHHISLGGEAKFRYWQLRYHPLRRIVTPQDKYGLGGMSIWSRRDDDFIPVALLTKWSLAQTKVHDLRAIFEPVPVEDYESLESVLRDEYEEAVRSGKISREEHDARMAWVAENYTASLTL